MPRTDNVSPVVQAGCPSVTEADLSFSSQAVFIQHQPLTCERSKAVCALCLVLLFTGGWSPTCAQSSYSGQHVIPPPICPSFSSFFAACCPNSVLTF